MKIKVIFFYLFIFAIKAFGQNPIKGKLIDFKTKKYIPFASFAYQNDTTQQGFYSDSLGNFSIKPLGLDIKISCIGYETKLMKISNLIEDAIIELNPIIYSLNSVEIKPRKTKIIQLGYFENKIYSRLILNSKKALLYRKFSNYIAQYIPNETNDNNLFIAKLKYNLSNHFKSPSPVNEKGCEPTLMRVHLFEVDKDTNRPGKELLGKNLIFKNNCQTDNLIVDVTDEYIYLPINGVFVGLEFIDNLNSIKSNYPFYLVNLNTSISSLNTYFSNHQQNWKTNSNEIIIKDKKIEFGFNVQFGIEVVK